MESRTILLTQDGSVSWSILLRKHNSFLDCRSVTADAGSILECITYQWLTATNGRHVRLSETCYQSSEIPTVSYMILYLFRFILGDGWKLEA